MEQPVLVPDRPWEGRRIYIYGSVHYDAGARLFRMWYNTRLGRGQQGRAPDLRSRTGDIILYATSEDGINWIKPSLGRHEFDGSRANNILLFDKHSPTVTVDADAPPDQRFKLACWDWAEGRNGLLGRTFGRRIELARVRRQPGSGWRRRDPRVSFGRPPPAHSRVLRLPPPLGGGARTRAALGGRRHQPGLHCLGQPRRLPVAG